MENKMIVDGVYLHINNGGISFKVTQGEYTTLEIEASHFGNTTNQIKMFVSTDNLKRIGQMLLDASELDTNVCEWLSLESRIIDKDTGETKLLPGQERIAFSGQASAEAAAGTTASETMVYGQNKWDDGSKFS